MISIETLTFPPSTEGLVITMISFKDEHNRDLGHVAFNQFPNGKPSVITFTPGKDLEQARTDPRFGDLAPGMFAAFLYPDPAKRLPMPNDPPADLPENVRRLFPEDEQ